MQDQAMAFYHGDGLVPTWQLARQYIGIGGRMATMPDIIDARLASEPGAVPWEWYFTTLSAEYVGVSRGGHKIMITAHGVGPMSTLDGIMNAYRYQYSDKTRTNRGGRISAEEFHKLEDGHYGEVFVVDYNDYVRRYQYPFIEIIRVGQALDDPLLHARFGGEERAVAYVEHHRQHAEAWHQQQLGAELINRHELPEREWRQYLGRVRAKHHQDKQDPYIIQVGDASNCIYTHHPCDDGLAVAHLLSISALSHTSHEGHDSLVCDLHSHEWNNGCRFVGIPAGANMSSIHRGWDSWQGLRKHWRSLLVDLPKPARIGFRPLMQLGDTWFTQYPSNGHTLATWEPEFRVTEIEPIGNPVRFSTEIHGHQIFFRYDLQEVQALAPPRANGFLMGEGEIIWEGGSPEKHTAMVQFYRIKADTTKRLRRVKDLEGNFETQMELLAK